MTMKFFNFTIFNIANEFVGPHAHSNNSLLQFQPFFLKINTSYIYKEISTTTPIRGF